ncbi:MAG: PorT family protein [Flavobacteriaceae bacterium]|nr:PorT family protein [Flavobacteriaceae bacterium]
MKKVVIILFVLGSIFSTNAQLLNVGVKGGLNYNSNGDLRGDIENIHISSDGDTGFHIGGFAEINLPLALYLRPELVYTHTKSDYNEQGNLSINKIDVPILIGFSVFKIGKIFAGPSFQYIISTDLKGSDVFNDIQENGFDNFSTGLQFGAGVELGKLGVDLRWERGLSDTEAKFTSDAIGEIKIDTRPQQFILSVYYKFR